LQGGSQEFESPRLHGDALHTARGAEMSHRMDDGARRWHH
jgi:hypothetical protein